jgi:hypothetical protein
MPCAVQWHEHTTFHHDECHIHTFAKLPSTTISDDALTLEPGAVRMCSSVQANNSCFDNKLRDCCSRKKLKCRATMALDVDAQTKDPAHNAQPAATPPCSTLLCGHPIGVRNFRRSGACDLVRRNLMGKDGDSGVTTNLCQV